MVTKVGSCPKIITPDTSASAMVAISATAENEVEKCPVFF